MTFNQFIKEVAAGKQSVGEKYKQEALEFIAYYTQTKKSIRSEASFCRWTNEHNPSDRIDTGGLTVLLEWQFLTRNNNK